MVEYRMFPGVVQNYEYEDPKEKFWTGTITTSKGGLTFYSNKIVRLPIGTELSLVCAISEIPSYKVEVISAYSLVVDPALSKQIKTMLKVVGEYHTDDIIALISSIFNQDLASIKSMLPRNVYVEWAVTNNIQSLSLNDILSHEYYNPFINDWITDKSTMNDLKIKSNSIDYDGTEINGFYIGHESIEHLKWLLKPPEVEIAIVSEDIKPNMNLDVLDSVMSIADTVFSRCGVHYLPLSNQGQHLYLQYLDQLGFNTYEVSELVSFYDYEKPCVIYGKSSDNTVWQNLISSLAPQDIHHESPLSVAVLENQNGFSASLKSKVSKFTAASGTVDDLVDRILAVFNQKNCLATTSVLEVGDKKLVYRGIIIGDYKKVVKLSSLCTNYLVWINPIASVR
jgi:hypothetical protein